MAREETRAPSVIVLFTDRQRWDETGVRGSSVDLAPSSHQMASAGADVHRSFTWHPGRMAACPGLRVGQCAGQTLGLDDRGRLAGHRLALPHHLGDARYRTPWIEERHFYTGPTGLLRGIAVAMTPCWPVLCLSCAPKPATASGTTKTTSGSRCLPPGSLLGPMLLSGPSRRAESSASFLSAASLNRTSRTSSSCPDGNRWPWAHRRRAAPRPAGRSVLMVLAMLGDTVSSARPIALPTRRRDSSALRGAAPTDMQGAVHGN